MLKKIRLKNFKLHEDTTIEASRINVFIGPNNSGKSSIFQGLLLLKKAMFKKAKSLVGPGPQRGTVVLGSPYLYGPDATVEVGEFKDVVRSPSAEVRIGLEAELQARDCPDPVLIGKSGVLPLGFDVYVHDDRLLRHEGWMRFTHNEARWGFPYAAPMAALIVSGANFVVTPLDDFTLFGVHATFGGPPQPERLAKVNAFTVFMQGVPQALMESLRPVLPLRGFEERGYPLPDKKPDSIDGLALNDRAVAIAALLAYDRDLEEKVSGILAEVLNLKVKVRLIEGKRATIWAESADRSRSETLFLNEGSGANQLPFVLVPIALASSGDSILLSEPEAHLHPKLQSELAGMILKLFRFAGGELQFFIETHSEHVLHTILNAVAKGDLKPEDVALYYFENKNGVAEASKREIDRHGQVDGGLPGFFEQSLAELSEYLKALSKP